MKFPTNPDAWNFCKMRVVHTTMYYDVFTMLPCHVYLCTTTHTHCCFCSYSKMNSLFLAALLLCGATVALASEHCSYEDAAILIKEWRHITSRGNSAPILLRAANVLLSGYVYIDHIFIVTVSKNIDNI